MKLPFWHRKQEQLEEELWGHLEMATRDRIDRGELSEQAASAARREFGNLALVRHVTRDQRAWTWLEDFFQDLRYAARTLRKNPGFTAVAVLMLGLGIGANTAIFSLIDTFLMRVLPVKDPQQLVFILATRLKGGTYGDFPYPIFEALRDRSSSFAGMFAWDDSHVTVTVDGQPEFVSGDFVSGSYWDVLGIHALLGRTFTADDDQPGRNPVAVISYPYWERRFARSPAAIGKTVYLARTPVTIIGVTSPKFFGRNVAGRSADLVLPTSLHPQFGLKDNDFKIMARLEPGVSTERARADLDVAFQQALTLEKGAQVSPWVERAIRAPRIVLEPGLRGASLPTNNFPTELRVLAGVVGIALVIVCVNLASLLLGRASARQKEIAVRLALGAGRGRLVRQLLTESVLLSALGGILGLVLANWGATLLLNVLSSDERQIPFELSPNIKVLALTAGVALLTGILFGLAPALTGTRLNLNPILKGSNGESERDGSHRGGLTKSLVACQIALSLSLVIGAGLLLRTLQRFYAVDTGFERNNVIQMWVFPVLNGYDHAGEMSLYRELLEKFSVTPGVQYASLSRLRMIFGRWNRDLWVPGTGTLSDATEARQVYCDPVGPHFFETMGIRLLRGRDFSVADTEISPRVAIVSESMARKFFPNEDPLGRRFSFNAAPSTADIEIVGIVNDIRHHLDSEQQLEAAWIPYTQATPDMYGQMNFLVRTAADPASLIPALRAQALLVDKNLPLVGVETQAAEVDEYLGGQRSMATLLTFFAALAVVLASIGLYGTMAHTVGRRTKELGIRRALGAQSKDMLRMVLRETLSIVVVGVLMGVPVALAATRLISSMLFGVEATDPLTIAAATLVMCATALFAAYVPARRAMRVDPAVALRYE